MIAKAVERANERLEEAGEPPPLPRLTPNGLRRTFASLLYGIGEYAHATRREPGENDRLKALVNGAELGGLGTSAHSNGTVKDRTRVADLDASRS